MCAFQVSAEEFDTADLVRSCVQRAVSMLRDVADTGTLSTRRVQNLLALLIDSMLTFLLSIKTSIP